MQITRTLSITAEEFFDQIEQSILADIKGATGKDISRAKLNGFKYKKRARGGGKGGTPMDVKVKHYRYPELYEVRFTYATGVNTLRYQVIEVGDGSLTIEYAEELEARGRVRQGHQGHHQPQALRCPHSPSGREDAQGYRRDGGARPQGA